MNVHGPTDSFDAQRPDDEVAGAGAGAASADILIGRMVDHEATLDDRERFERLAVDDPQLWKSLAIRQQDMMALANRLDEQTRFAERIDLPSSSSTARWPWLVTLSGLAAVVVIAAMWRATPQEGSPANRLPNAETVVAPIALTLTADEHFAAYLKAGKETGQVINLMPSALLEATDLPDGRVNLRVIRRIEENLVVEQAPELDDRGNLKVDPSELRESSPAARTATEPQ